ncbi:sugar phosphate isomerase/epimerase family protein [Paraburkholderia oxyphila]|uniref:sugar phosphate isomerase/epimerase family protein n=1 Tax=Paraburkholderia oxyphila TaxID=614212 RepID=UPI0005B997D2|nr:sugar phosphate isomerase/epimerase [Paraburkholderia oxyphila]
MKPQIGVAHLTALDLNPGTFVKQAAKAGFSSVGLRVVPVAPGAPAYPTKVGSAEHLELRRLLESEGMELHDIEFIQIKPDIDVLSYESILEAGADLGARAVTVSGDDSDFARLTKNFGEMCDLAARFGLRVDIEFMKWRHVGTLQQACAVVDGAGKTNGAVLVDALHLSRSGGTPDQLKRLRSDMVRSVQLCDAAAQAPRDDEATIAEARGGRLFPGEGVLPLVELLRALPSGRDTAISVEMPFPSLESEARLELAWQSAMATLERAGN